jgi:hypothetical protein
MFGTKIGLSILLDFSLGCFNFSVRSVSIVFPLLNNDFLSFEEFAKVFPKIELF